MALDFGNIQDVEELGDEVRITGLKWVGLALDRNDPYVVMRLLGVEANGITRENLAALRQAGDVYDSQITQEEGRTVVRVDIHGEVFLELRCRQVMEEFRYFKAAELRKIFAWLPSQSTPAELDRYTTIVRGRGFLVSWSEGEVRVVEDMVKP